MGTRRFQSAEIAFDVPARRPDDSRCRSSFPEAATSLDLTDGAVGPEPTLAACARQVLRQLHVSLPAMQLVSREDVEIGAAKGVWLTVDWQRPHASFRTIVIFAIAEGTLWTLAASSSRDRLPEVACAIDGAMCARSRSIETCTKGGRC